MQEKARKAQLPFYSSLKYLDPRIVLCGVNYEFMFTLVLNIVSV